MQQERSSTTRQDSLLRVSHKYLALIITTHGHLWQNLDQSSFYLPQLQNMDGPSICLTSTVPSSMENLILMKKFIWSSLNDMKNQTKNSTCVNYSNPCMDSNRQAENGTTPFAECLLILDDLKLTQLSSMLTRMETSPYLPAMSTIA